MPPNHPPSFQFYPRDFVSSRSVRLMTPEERGGYIMLLCHAWMSDSPGTLPLDEEVLAALSELRDRWPECREAILRAFDRGSPDEAPVLIQTRMREERDRQVGYQRAASEGGKVRMRNMPADARAMLARHAANSRWHKEECQPMPADASISSASASASAFAFDFDSEREKEETPTPLANGGAIDRGAGRVIDPEKAKATREWTTAFQECFWPIYPRRVKKAAALKAWLGLMRGRPYGQLEELLSRICNGVDWCITEEWKGREMEKIPHASTFLNAQQWEDAFDETDGKTLAEVSQ